MGKTFRRVLVYRLGSLGDTIVALPCFHLIRRAFPDAHLTLLTNVPVGAKAAPIEGILGPDFFDEVLSYPVGLRDPREAFALVRRLRRGRFDAVVHMAAARGWKSAWRDRVFFRLAGVRSPFGLSPAAAPTDESEPEYRRLARRLETLGDARIEDDASWDLALTPAEISRADELLDLPPGQPVIAVSCGTKWRTNDWEEPNWLALVRRLPALCPGAALVVLGAAEESERATRLTREWPGPTRNLCGMATPRVSAAALRHVRLFIGHDSGPLHLAACMGAPCVGIFSARNRPGQWFPRGTRTRVIYHATECLGCELETCEVHRKKCILSITPDEVLAAATELLETKEAQP